MINIGLHSEDRTLHTLLSSAFGKEFNILLGLDEAEMNRLCASGDCDVLILDLNSNQDLLQDHIRYAHRLLASHIPIVVMADDALRLTAFELVRSGAFGYCRRPPSIRDLKAMINQAYEDSALRQQLQTTQPPVEVHGNCDQLIGSSPQMKRVYQLIHRVENLNASVLITGESGTGKELIARAIHNLGSRANHPFVAVSCGGILETLMDAELFGHESGVLADSNGAQEGYFEQAADGTLFLDEIGDLNLSTQIKLLRVLQQMEFSRLGSNNPIALRARLIFATHQNLNKLVAEGKFRKDLYYRINVLRIEAPSLQKHLADIPCLARHFLQHYGQLFQKPIEDIDPHALTLLQHHQWSGNVRELENVMQRAIVRAPGNTLRAEDLSLSLEEVNANTGESDGIVDIGDYQSEGSFERQVRNYKVKLAVAAIHENNGNKTLAARSLCISRAYLHRLIRLAEPDQQQAIGNAESA